MNTESIPPPPPTSSESTEETHPLSLPIFLSTSSSSLKPLRERNRTNLKRRINLSRSQVLSNDFENEDNLPTTDNSNKPTTITTNSQPSSTPTIHTHTELYSKTISPKTPSPIHTTVTCSQVWERLASNEEHQNPISPKSVTTSTSSLPTHISFSYDRSDDEEREDLPNDDKDDFQYVPVSSQSKLVQFQFLTFARQQHLGLTSDDGNNEKKDVDGDDDDEEEEDKDTIIGQNMKEDEEENEEEEEQENRSSKKRKRSVSTTDSLDGIPALSATSNDATVASSMTKPSRTKKT